MADDTQEKLRLAIAECVRLESENAALRAERTPKVTESRIKVEAIRASARWLDGLRMETWNGGERKITNYHRAAEDLYRRADQISRAAALDEMEG